MKLKQLSVFLENKRGYLREICALLADNNINMITISLADTEQFGVLRLIVCDCEKAKKVVENHGYTANITEVVAIEIYDQPGGLRDVLQIEDKAGVNVEYMYALTIKSGENAILLFKFDDMDKAIEALQEANFKIFSNEDLKKRINN